MARSTQKSQRQAASNQKWIQNAVSKPGQLHRDLGVPQDQKIPAAQLQAATKKKGKVGQRARAAVNMKKANQ